MKSLKDRTRNEKALAMGQQFAIERGQLISMPDNANSYISGAYNVNDIVYSIINLILDKVRLPSWGLYEVKDESSLKGYQSLQQRKNLSAKDYNRMVELRHKALDPVRNGGKWGDLLQHPNEYQTFQDFVAHGCGFKLLTGNKYIWADLLPAGANAGYPQELWLLPSQWMQILVTPTFPSRVTGYRLSSVLVKQEGFTTEEVLHEKYPNYNWNINGEQHYGISPLKAALRLTNRNNSALESSTAKFQNGGLDAIVYIDEQNLPNEVRHEQAKSTKERLISEYTGARNWGKIVSSPFKMGAVNLGLSPVELDIIQAEKWDLRRFCNIFGVPSQLLNDPDNKVYNNTKEGEKALTNRCAMPLLTAFRDNLNRMGHRYWKLDKRYIADFDVDCFSELQADIKEVVEWTDRMLAITPNEQRELAGLATLKGPLYDEPWLKSGDREPASEWALNPVDRALDEGDEDE